MPGVLKNKREESLFCDHRVTNVTNKVMNWGCGLPVNQVDGGL